MKLPFILIGSLLLLISNTSYPQQFNVKTYSFAEGLSTYNIKKAVQDKYGFIWLATQYGVYRYDGTSFDAYKKSADISNSIRENFIFDIALGNDENLYIASFNAGVDVINIRTQEVNHLLSEEKDNEEYSDGACFHYALWLQNHKEKICWHCWHQKNSRCEKINNQGNFGL